MNITKPVVEGVIKLMGKDYPDYKVFTFPIPEKDWIRRGMEDLKAHLRAQLKKNCKPLKTAIEQLKAEREGDQVIQQDLILDQEDEQPPAKPEISIGKNSVRKTKDPATGQQAPTKQEDLEGITASNPNKVRLIHPTDRIYTDEERIVIRRELEIHDLSKKMAVNKREFKAWFKRLQELIAQRNQTVFTSDDPANE